MQIPEQDTWKKHDLPAKGSATLQAIGTNRGQRQTKRRAMRLPGPRCRQFALGPTQSIRAIHLLLWFASHARLKSRFELWNCTSISCPETNLSVKIGINRSTSQAS
jgi:hypothetical protein